MMTSRPSLPCRITAWCLAFLFFVLTSGGGRLRGQDIYGGSSADLGSAGALENRLGIGVFTNPQNFAHARKPFVKAPIARVKKPRFTETTRTDPRPTPTPSRPRPSDPEKPPQVSAQALIDQADDFFDAKDYEKAVAAYKKVLELQPKNFSVQLDLGNSYFNWGQYEAAAAAYQKATKLIAERNRPELKPDLAEAFHKLGDAYLKLEKKTEAIPALQQASQLDPQNRETKASLSLAHYDQGVEAYNAGKYDAAIASYQKAIEIKPDYDDAYNNLGDAYRRLEKLPEATKAYEQAKRYNGNREDTYTNLAWVLDKQGRYLEALDSYRELLRLKPNDPEVHNNRGYALGKTRNWGPAIQEFQQAAKLKSDYAEPYINLGWAYNNTAQFKQAVAPLKRAIQLQPNLPEEHFNLGITYSRLGQKKEALASFQQAVSLKPDWAQAQNNLGFAYGSSGKWKEAIAAHKKAAEIDPTYAGANFNLGYAYLKDKNKDGAIEQYNILQQKNKRLANRLYVLIYNKQPPA